jgi:hypothetical protein
MAMEPLYRAGINCTAAWKRVNCIGRKDVVMPTHLQLAERVLQLAAVAPVLLGLRTEWALVRVRVVVRGMVAALLLRLCAACGPVHEEGEGESSSWTTLPCTRTLPALDPQR